MWEHKFQDGPHESGTCPTGRCLYVTGPSRENIMRELPGVRAKGREAWSLLWG